MSNDERGALEITKDAFSSIEALVKDAHGNAIFGGNDPKRIRIGAGYLRLCSTKSCALSSLLDAVADGNKRAGDAAKRRLSAVELEINKYLDKVAIDNKRWAKESGAIQMEISGEELQQLMKGEQPKELIARIEAMRKEKESA